MTRFIAKSICINIIYVKIVFIDVHIIHLAADIPGAMIDRIMTESAL